MTCEEPRARIRGHVKDCPSLRSHIPYGLADAMADAGILSRPSRTEPRPANPGGGGQPAVGAVRKLGRRGEAAPLCRAAAVETAGLALRRWKRPDAFHRHHQPRMVRRSPPAMSPGEDRDDRTCPRRNQERLWSCVLAQPACGGQRRLVHHCLDFLQHRQRNQRPVLRTSQTARHA